MHRNSNKPSSPGSFNDFQERHSDLAVGSAWSNYQEATERYRNELAAFYGVTLEELHLGEIGLSTTTEYVGAEESVLV